jgi:hypothetical protein
MSFVAVVKNWLGIKTEPQTEVKATTKRSPLQMLAVWATSLVLAGTVMVQQVAAEINLSVITETINAFIDLIDPITDLVIAIVPLWFVIMILGFIMGLLAAILGLIKSGMKF